MDHRIHYRIVIDTETCPLNPQMQGVNPNNMLTYDIGWVVVDKRGNVYKKRSYIVYEVFIQRRANMKTAYYADKIPTYWEQIHSKNRILAKWATIQRRLAEDIQKYSIDEIYAHNASFDRGTIQKTSEILNLESSMIPENAVWCDTLKMARDVFLTQPTYIRFCTEHGYLDKNEKPRATAEILYRYITMNNDFEESHMALEDVMIEKDIMAYCYRQHKKMRKYL